MKKQDILVILEQLEEEMSRVKSTVTILELLTKDHTHLSSNSKNNKK